LQAKANATRFSAFVDNEFKAVWLADKKGHRVVYQVSTLTGNKIALDYSIVKQKPNSA
jgi:hypothetical protein